MKKATSKSSLTQLAMGDLLLKGATAFDTGNISGAVDCARLVLEQDANHVDALRLIMRASYRGNDLDSSARAAQQLITLGKLKNEAEVMLARIASLGADQQDAVQRWHAVAEANPSFVEARTQVAVCFLKLEKYETAAEAARLALEQAPTNRIALRSLSRALMGVGKMEDAAAALISLIPVSASDVAVGVRALVRSGDILAAARVLVAGRDAIEDCDPEISARIMQLLRQRAGWKASEHSNKADVMRLLLALHPEDEALRLELARHVVDAGDMQEGVELISGLAASSLELPGASALVRNLVVRARGLFADGDFAGAYASAMAALSLDPSIENLKALLPRIQARRFSDARKALVEKRDNAFEATASLIQDYPDDLTAQRLYIRALIGARRYEEAKALLVPMIQMSEATADDFVQFARVSRATHDVETAIGACFDALSHTAEYPAALSLLALLIPARK